MNERLCECGHRDLDHASDGRRECGVGPLGHDGCCPCTNFLPKGSQRIALTHVREGLAFLERDHRGRGADFNLRRLKLLLDWFAHVGETETTVEAFLAYANAIGCATLWQRDPRAPAFPILTVEGLLKGDAVETRARLVEMIGTNADAALRAFVGALSERA